MPVFVHLTSHRNLPAIRRGGIALVKKERIRPAGVYAMPVTRSFYVSHQWLRELRRQGGGTIVGVYFRLSDDERVMVGHYNSVHVEMAAAEAAALMLAAEGRDPAAAREADAEAARRHDKRWRGKKAPPPPTSPEGFEVIVPRRIERSEIVRVKALPQVVGWRYAPGSHGKRPCLCVCCEKGTYGVRKMVRRVEAEEAAGKASKVTVFGRD